MEEQETKTESIKNTAENLAEHVTDYVETYLKLGVVTAVQKGTEVGSAALAAILLSVIGLFVLLFASIGSAVWLNEALDNPMAGYFVVAGFYVFCVILFLAFRKKLIIPFLRNHLVGKRS